MNAIPGIGGRFVSIVLLIAAMTACGAESATAPSVRTQATGVSTIAPSTPVAASPVATPTANQATSTETSTDAATGMTSLRTRDGLALLFDSRENRFMRIDIQQQTFPLKPGESIAVHLFDPRGNTMLDPRNASVIRSERVADALVITRESRSSALQVVETWTERPNRIDLATAITNTDPSTPSRAIEACLQIPINLIGKYWHHHLDDREMIVERREPYKTVLQRLIDIGSFGDGTFHMKTDLDINLNGINLISDDNIGLALSINPDQPAAYYVRYDTQRRSYDACFHLGIYNEHIRFKNTVSFALSLFVPDEPSWGLRSAYAKYVDIYPQAHTGKLPRKTTMVVLEEYSYHVFPNPLDYRIGAVWGRYKAQNRRFGVDDLVYIWPHGYYDRGMRLKVSPAPGGSDPTWETDIAACLALYRDVDQGRQPFAETCTGSYPFATCTRQRNRGQIYGPVLERERGSGWRSVEAYQMTVSNGPNFLMDKFRLPAPFEASLLQDANGRWRDSISYASMITEVSWEPGVRRCIFDGINPDPGIDVMPSNEPRTVAPTIVRNFGELNLEVVKRANGLYGPDYLDTHPEEGINLYHGVAVDTVGVYLRPDFNPRALRTASLPLSYDRATGRVVALEHLTTLGFLRALRASLPDDAPIATSGPPISGILYQESDYIVEEFVKIERDGRLVDEFYDETLANKVRLINRIRMGANQRSVTFTVPFERATNENEFLDQINRYLPLYTATGIYINIDRYGPRQDRYLWSDPPGSRAMKAYQHHLHIVHALNSAGWRPVPYASAANGVLIERFGRDYLTLYNTAENTITTTLTINWRAIGFSAAPHQITDAETGAELPFSVSGDYLVLDPLSIGGHKARIVRIEPPRRTVLLPMVVAM